MKGFIKTLTALLLVLTLGIFNSEYDHYWHDYTAAVV